MDIDDIFNRLLWAPDFPTTRHFSNFDMYEKDGRLNVSVEVPGVDLDDVELRISKDRVQLKSKQKEEAERADDDGKTWYSKKTTTSFNYDLSLPFEIDTDKAEASFEKGVISISAPRLQVSESRVLSIKKS
jgi:HSP20 family protein